MPLLVCIIRSMTNETGGTMKKSLFILGLAAVQAAFAQSPQYSESSGPYEGIKVQRGFVVSGYRVDPSADVDTGFGWDVNYSSVAINGGVASKKFGESPLRPSTREDPNPVVDEERVNNVYIGTGFSRVIQFQYGYGNHGDVLRLRSDFNFRAIADFFQDTRTPKHQLTLADRLTFTASLEEYLDDEEKGFDNFTWGIGLLF
jgi:hypothetical protein